MQNIENTKNVLINSLPEFIKEEYLENLAYFYGYKNKVEVQKSREVQVELENGETENRIEYYSELENNPVSRDNFIWCKIFDDFVKDIQNKIKQGGMIKLEKKIEKDSEKLFN